MTKKKSTYGRKDTKRMKSNRIKLKCMKTKRIKKRKLYEKN
jgi:hypothetical protein